MTDYPSHSSHQHLKPALKMILANFSPFDGQHCETTATGTLLNQLGIHVSEPMLFGLGEGLGFIFWNMKSMPFPFIGGRVKPDALTTNISKNLNLELLAKETTSPQKAWEQVKALLDQGLVVGLKLDCYHLEYFSNPIHFAGHYVAIHGYDEQFAYLVDTRQQGGLVKTSLPSLALARAEKGPMSSKNLHYTLSKRASEGDSNLALKTAVLNAIKNNAADYLNPPITNIGYKGIIKASNEIIKWFDRTKDIEGDFKTTAMLMERAGTGGALFRNLYRDFLEESYDLLGMEQLRMAHHAFIDIAQLWTQVSQLFDETSRTKDIQYIQQASADLKTLAFQEKVVMSLLLNL
jgi:Domain of unknown function (DUF4872)/Butirosin biosynthesis protein H, N-terminal